MKTVLLALLFAVLIVVVLSLLSHLTQPISTS